MALIVLTIALIVLSRRRVNRQPANRRRPQPLQRESLGLFVIIFLYLQLTRPTKDRGAIVSFSFALIPETFWPGGSASPFEINGTATPNFTSNAIGRP
jgi:hypothetical protein